MARIAVVEDNADNRLLLATLLEDDHEIVEYAHGQSALDGIRGDRPDVVLLDISLPGLDGTEVLRRLRADPSTASVPVVALTAHAMAGDEERFLAQGFDAYVSKPIVDEEILFAAIARLLTRSSEA